MANLPARAVPAAVAVRRPANTPAQPDTTKPVRGGPRADIFIAVFVVAILAAGLGGLFLSLGVQAP